MEYWRNNMANTFELIASTTLSSAQANIDFTSIPSTYTDLCLKFSVRTAQAEVATWLKIAFNGSAASFSSRYLAGNGSAASANTLAQYGGDAVSANSTSSTFSNVEIYITNYVSSINKTYYVNSVTENNATEAYTLSAGGLWSNSAAINQITLTPNTGANFLQHSSAHLYGIKNS
jgi:hypothetical protein